LKPHYELAGSFVNLMTFSSAMTNNDLVEILNRQKVVGMPCSALECAWWKTESERKNRGKEMMVMSTVIRL